MAAGPLPARQETRLHARGITVRASPGAEEAARQALKLASRDLPRIARRLELPVPKEVTIIIARRASQVPPGLASSMPPWAAGGAFPFRRVLVVRLDRLSLAPGGSFQVVLRHELVHLVMGGAGPETFRKLPWWFHEGTAQLLSGLPFFAQEEDLGLLVKLNLLPYLDELGSGEDQGRRAPDLAYQAAFSFASFLEDRLGEDVFARILRAQEKAPDFDKAFLRATGLSYISLEAQWRALLLSRPWATIQKIAGEFFLILLVLSLPLVGLALRRRFQREEEIERAWKEEEEFEEAPAKEGPEGFPAGSALEIPWEESPWEGPPEDEEDEKAP